MKPYCSIAIGMFVLGMTGTLPLPVQGAAAPACGMFVLEQQQWNSVRHLDHAEPGASVGDRRVGVVHYVDENNDDVGLVHINSVVTSRDDAGDTFQLMGLFHSVFSNGSIIWSGIYSIPDPATEGRPKLGEETYAIIGGTGDFSNARGQLRIFNDDNDRRMAEFDVVCPD